MWPKGSLNLDDNSSALMIEATEIYDGFEFNVPQNRLQRVLKSE